MNNTIEKKSNAPILIIGGVLLLAVLGGWWLFSSSKPSPNSNTAKTNTANTVKTTGIPANAPQGASPPNQSGSPTALVTLEEFADFQCPQCAAKDPLMKEIKAAYGSRIHFIFRNFPLSIPAHDKSYDAAVAAQAAAMQGKFWDMQNILFTNQKAWTADPNFRQIWKDYAQKIGLDVPKWENEMAGIATKNMVNEDMKRGKTIGINSTPSLYINGVEVQFEQMSLEGLRQLIDAELQKAMPQNPTASTAPANSNK